MKVYVEEKDMPKSCRECPCCNMCMDYGDTCKLTNKTVSHHSVRLTKPQDCPLKSLTDHTKQVRKEVVEFIDKCMKMQDHSCIWINPDGTEFSVDVGYVCEWWDEFKQKLLDKIQGE